jgi:hypothetical protein
MILNINLVANKFHKRYVITPCLVLQPIDLWLAFNITMSYVTVRSPIIPCRECNRLECPTWNILLDRERLFFFLYSY